MTHEHADRDGTEPPTTAGRFADGGYTGHIGDGGTLRVERVGQTVDGQCLYSINGGEPQRVYSAEEVKAVGRDVRAGESRRGGLSSLGEEVSRLFRVLDPTVADEPVGDRFVWEVGDTGEALLSDEAALVALSGALGATPAELAAGPSAARATPAQVVFAHTLAERDISRDPLRSLHDTIVFSSNDWSGARDFAWIYGIVVGWDGDEPDEDDDDPMAELAQKFGWSSTQVLRLRDLHHAFVGLAAGGAVSPATGGRPGDDAETLVPASPVERDDLWSAIDWTLWGSGMGDTFREPLADKMLSALTPEERAQALAIMADWRERRGKHADLMTYEDMKAEQAELRAEVERLREDAAEYGPLLTRQGDLLTGVANALRGQPPELTHWGHHDLPQRAADLAAYAQHEADASTGFLARTEAAERALADERAKLARVEAVVDDLATYREAGRAAPWVGRIRAALAGPEPEATEDVAWFETDGDARYPTREGVDVEGKPAHGWTCDCDECAEGGA